MREVTALCLKDALESSSTVQIDAAVSVVIEYIIGLNLRVIVNDLRDPDDS